MLKKLSTAVVSAVAAVALVACSGGASDVAAPAKSSAPSAASSSARTVEEIKQAGSVNLGVFSDKAPFGSVDASGKPVGYDIEYGKRIAEDLGVEAKFVPVEAASRVEFLTSGKVDIILANFTVTKERAEKVDFADPYMKVSLGVVTPDAKPITNPDDLADKNLIVVRGTTADTYVTEHYPNAKVTKYEQYTEATGALLDGRGDAWVTDNTEALAWAKANEGFSTTIPTLGDPDTIAAAVAKGNSSLLNFLNEELVTLGKEKFFLDAYKKTLEPVYGDQISPEEIVVEK